MSNLKPVPDPKELVQRIEKVEEQLKQASRFGTRTYVPSTVQQRHQQYMDDEAVLKQAIEANVPFISPDFSGNFRLTQGLVLVAAISGKSKSTTMSNIVAGYLSKHSEKKVIVISNEDASNATYNRIACHILKYSFVKLQSGRLPPMHKQEVSDLARSLMENVEVIAGDRGYDMTCVEDVMGVLEYASNSGAGLIGLDYLQTITWSRNNQAWESFRVLKHFGDFMLNYGRRVPVPVVVLAQLKSASEKALLIKDRVENDRTIYNHCFQAIELIPDFETLVTKFKIHKDRFFGCGGKEIEMRFSEGRYEPVGSDTI